MCRESSIPLPNTSPDMSPIPTTVKSLALDVGAELAEVALDRLPRAARGDPHLLVVVAVGAAGGERVAEPEAVLGGDLVGDVRERRGALVGGDDEVRVVVVVADDALGRDDLAADDVVGHVEQAAEERAVARDRLSRQRLAAGCRRGGRLTTKPPFAPTGTISAFLTICAFISPRISVRKSSRRSDQRRPPRATLPPRRCTPSTRGEYTKISNCGRGSGSSGIERRVELEREVVGRGAVVVRAEVVRAQHRADHGQEVAQDAVLVEALDRVDRAFDLALEPLGVLPSRARSGSNRAGNSSTSSVAISGCARSVRSM